MSDDLPPPPPPDALGALLPPDVDLDRGWRHEAARPIWYGVVWGRLGRGDLAVAHWDRVRLPALWPWIAAERGRVLRELGLHAAAETLEFPAALQAEDPTDLAMLRISLTADAVGQGDASRAERRLDAARSAVAALSASDPRAARQRTRLTWVEVEVAFLTGRPPPLAGIIDLGADGEVVLPPEAVWWSAFHHAKALLFAGIARARPELLDRAAEVSPPVLRWAVELARADHGRPGARRAARAAWSVIVPPPEVAEAVARTDTARRLRGGRADEGHPGGA